MPCQQMRQRGFAGANISFYRYKMVIHLFNMRICNLAKYENEELQNN